MTSRDPDIDAFDLGTAVAITGTAVSGYVTLKPLLVGAGVPGAVAYVAAQCMIVLAITLGGRGSYLPERLGLRPAPVRYFVAAVLVGSSVWFVDAWVTRWIVAALGPPPAAVIPDVGLVPGLVIIGVLAPVLEEVLFRGVLTRSLATRWSWPATIAVSAIAFAIVHQSPYRLVAPLLIGAIAAYITLRARSIVPAIVIHFLNNTILVLQAQGIGADLTRSIFAHADALIAPAVATMLVGVALAGIGKRTPSAQASARSLAPRSCENNSRGRRQ